MEDQSQQASFSRYVNYLCYYFTRRNRSIWIFNTLPLQDASQFGKTQNMNPTTAPEHKRIKTEPNTTYRNTTNELPTPALPLAWKGLKTSLPMHRPTSTARPPASALPPPQPPPRPATAQPTASRPVPAAVNLALGKRKHPEEDENVKLRAPPSTAVSVLEYEITAEMNKPKIYMKRPFTIQFLSGALGLSDRKTDPLT